MLELLTPILIWIYLQNLVQVSASKSALKFSLRISLQPSLNNKNLCVNQSMTRVTMIRLLSDKKRLLKLTKGSLSFSSSNVTNLFSHQLLMKWIATFQNAIYSYPKGWTHSALFARQSRALFFISPRALVIISVGRAMISLRRFISSWFKFAGRGLL